MAEPALDFLLCKTLFETAMICLEEDRPKIFKKKMIEAIKDAEILLASLETKISQNNGASNNTENHADTAGSDELEEIKDFITTSCAEIGSFLLDEDVGDNDNDPDGTAPANRARPYLERALQLFRSQDDVCKSYFKQTVLDLSSIYATLHLHDEDINLCRDYLDRLTKKYNEWTPLQIEALASLALAYNNTRRLAEAEALYKQIVLLSKTNFGKDSEKSKEAEEDLMLFRQEKQALICPCQSGIV